MTAPSMAEALHAPDWRALHLLVAALAITPQRPVVIVRVSWAGLSNNDVINIARVSINRSSRLPPAPREQ